MPLAFKNCPKLEEIFAGQRDELPHLALGEKVVEAKCALPTQTPRFPAVTRHLDPTTYILILQLLVYDFTQLTQTVLVLGEVPRGEVLCAPAPSAVKKYLGGSRRLSLKLATFSPARRGPSVGFADPRLAPSRGFPRLRGLFPTHEGPRDSSTRGGDVALLRQSASMANGRYAENKKHGFSL